MPHKNKKESPRKEAHDVMGERYYEMQGLFEKAQEVAMYYGFTPIATPIFEDRDLFDRGIGETTALIQKKLFTLHPSDGTKMALRPEGTTGALRAYFENDFHKLPDPQMFYYFGPMFRQHHKKHPEQYPQFHQFGLEIIGTKKPVAEGLIIKTLLTILYECGATENLNIRLNSIGDADSQKSYGRELRNFYRKNLTSLSAHDRTLVRDYPMAILGSTDKSTRELNQEAPDPLAYLSSRSKKHFKEVLEYLEELDICYQIDKTLVRDFSYYSETIFSIETHPALKKEHPDEDTKEVESEDPDTKEETPNEDECPTEIPEDTYTLSGGGRYNYLSKRIGHNDEIASAGGAFKAESVLDADWWKKLTPRIIKEPWIYFIQIGFEARLKSLYILEELRKAKIPVKQKISADSLSDQLEEAKQSHVPFTIIFGQREVLDDTVIVRNMSTRAQKTIPISEMVHYLRSVK